MSVAVGTGPPWRSHDPRSLMRARWERLARAEAHAAEEAGEEHVARAFRAVALTLATDHAVPPPENGRIVLLGRAGLRAPAVELVAAGMSYREAAIVVNVPAGTVYHWARREGVGRRRAAWLAEDAAESMRRAQRASPNGRRHTV
jgi:hypothetical protein